MSDTEPCNGAGIAVGGAYFLYIKWQKYQQQCQEENNEPTLEKSKHFIPNFDEWIMERNRLSACAKETNGNASDDGKTETTNLHRTENASVTKNNKTGDDVRSDQDLPLSTDGARNNTFNMSDNNLGNFGPDFLKMYLKGTDIDLDAFYGEMNEFFAGLSEADRVSHPDSEQTTLEHGQSSEAGPSSYSSSPSTSGFQPNGDGMRRGSKQLANRRFSTRKHKKD